jgi:hypothetical protein
MEFYEELGLFEKSLPKNLIDQEVKVKAAPP